MLEVFRDAYRFATSIEALEEQQRPPGLTEANAQRYGVAAPCRSLEMVFIDP